MASVNEKELTIVTLPDEVVIEDFSEEHEVPCMCQKLLQFKRLACPKCRATMENETTIVKGTVMSCQKCGHMLVITSVTWRPNVTVEEIDAAVIIN